MRFMIVALALISGFGFTACQPAAWTERAGQEEVAPSNGPLSVSSVSIDSCATGRLYVGFKEADGTRADLVSALKIFADYPQLKMQPVAAGEREAAFVLSLNQNCLTSACAEAAGWSQIQLRLAAFNGVSLQCYSGPLASTPADPAPICEPDESSNPNADVKQDIPKQDPPKQDHPKQDAPKQDDDQGTIPIPGGGTGGTGGE